MSNTENQKRRRAERARAFLEELTDRYPRCFARQRQGVRPLAVGIHDRLKAALAEDPELADTANWVLKQALARYTHSPAYLQAVIAGHPRVDLDGSDAGPVTEDARRHARLRREEQKKRAAERHRGRSGRRQPPGDEPHRRQLERLAEKFNNR